MGLTISGRALGARRALFDAFSVPVPPGADPRRGEGGDGLRLRDLIAHIVRHEVAAFRQSQDAKRFLRALSDQQITTGLSAGKVDAGGSEIRQSIDEDQAVIAALQAFEDGLYLVVLDGLEQRDLDARVALEPDSKLAFVRLTFLAGA